MKTSWNIKAVVLIAIATNASAGTILMPPPVARDPAASRDEQFPESQFGHAPAPRAAREADQWDGQSLRTETADTQFGARRGPASVTAVAPSELEALSARRKGVQEVALIAGDLGYFPKTVFVTRDIPVRMFVTGASRGTLCLMMDSFQVRKQVRSQKIEEITFTPNVPGKYRFYCPVNGMEGTLIVKELTGA